MAKDNRLPSDPAKRAYWLAYGSVILRAMEKRGMKYTDLAKRVEVSPATISRIFQGRVQVNAFNHFRICSVFGWQLSVFDKALEKEKLRLASIEELNRQYPAL